MMRTSLACFAAALVLASAPTAGTNLGVLDLTSGSIGFGNTPNAGSFTDVATFTLVTSSTLSSSIVSTLLANRDVDFTSIAISGPGGTFNLTTFGGDPFEIWALSNTTLAAGTYTMTLDGTNTAASGSYGGNLGVTPLNGSTGGGTPGPNGHVLDLSQGTTALFNTPSLGSFTDTYFFSLTTSGFVGGGITSSLNGNQDVDFTSISLTGPTGDISFTQFLGDPFETWVLSGMPVSPGSYNLMVSGVNSAGGGSYGGNFAVTTQAVIGIVPEPAPLALLLGAVAAGALIRRRPHR